MVETNELLEWSSLTAIVNEIKSPNQFLKRSLYGDHETKPTEKVEIGVLIGGRKIAPFVRKNAEALMVDGHSERFDVVEAPNIRIKRAFTPSELLFKRRPGTVIFSPGGQTQMQAAEQHVARDMARMADMITNAEEWLCALTLRNVISYSVSEEENFTITFGRPNAHAVNLVTTWDDVDPQAPTPDEDFFTAKKLIHDEVGLPVTDAIMGSEAGTQFRRLMKAQPTLDKLYVDAGRFTLQEQFNQDGVIFLGVFCGIRCWQYSRSADLNGTDTPMIRAKYVEFVANVPAAEFRLYYGAIADMDAFEGRMFQSERFAKSWKEPDPSQWIALLNSRPVPVPRRPGATASFKVVSG